MKDALSLGIELLKEDFKDTTLYLCKNYWESKGKKGFNYIIDKEIINIHDKGLSPLPYLLDLFKQYPDAPDIMSLLVTYLYNNDEELLAYKVSCKLVSLYPHEEYLNENKLRGIMVKWELATEPETVEECINELEIWLKK